MEEQVNSEPKKVHFISKKTFNKSNSNKKEEINSKNYAKSKSCNDLKNFVPRITPKKSNCIPSLLILNPDVIEKKHSDEIKEKLFLEKDSNDNSRDLSLESSKDEKNNNLTNEIIINNNINNIQSENFERNLKDDYNLKNKPISDFKENIYNIYDNGEYFTILDILSMNKSNIV